MDLNHAMPLAHPTRIWAGNYADCANAAVTVVTAGSAQKTGETRLDLVQRNYNIYKTIIPNIIEYNTTGLLLVATNPVDILSYAAWKLSGLPANRVIGSGTVLDTARFRYLLSQHAGVDPRSVHAYIIGEHGDSEVPVWSLANIAGMHLQDYCQANCIEFDPGVYEHIFEQTRNAAYEIIERKGATYYAVANGLLRIIEAIIRDQSTVISVSSLIDDFLGIHDIYLSLPCVIDRNGINHFLHLTLDAKETEGLQNSARVLGDLISKLGIA
jgi:L-lactate dehydrogenase